jgi:hypothetical protein
MKQINPMLCCIVYRGSQADGMAGAQTRMCPGSSYHPLDDILPPPVEDMIDDIVEDWEKDGKM